MSRSEGFNTSRGGDATGVTDVRQVVVVGASAGGVEATTEVVRRLPGDVAAPVLVAVHVASGAPSALPGILQRASGLPARHPADGDALRNGVIYVAPPDHHLLVGPDGRVRVVHGPRENGHRPAIDPLFRSAARYYGPRAVGIVLSGVLDDGAAGLRVLTDAGGTAVVQDPDDAMYPPMPLNAIAAADVEHVLPLADIGALVAKLVHEMDARAVETMPVYDDRLDVELALTTMTVDDAAEGESVAPASSYSCPDCHGVLNEIKEAGDVRYRCRVGHAWSPESLLAAKTEALEAALWMALRTLEEKALLARRLAARAHENGSAFSHARFTDQADDAQRGADAIRTLLARSATVVAPEAEATG